MQSNWQDILVLGLLVLVFGVIYRRRASLRLRFWIAGWLFVLAHFAILLPHPETPFWENMQAVLGVSGLILAGVCFILASTACYLTPRDLILVGIACSVPAIVYLFLVAFDYSQLLLLFGLVVVGESLAAWTGYRFISNRGVALWINNIAAALFGACLFILIARKYADLGMAVILMQIFLVNAVLFWSDFRRISVGVITASAGLLAWAMVFPVGVTIAQFFPHLAVPPRIWNVPKYFVEFGMILTLMENQILAAKWQGEQYRLLFDSNPHPMFIYDTGSFSFLRINDAALRQYGYGRQEFLSLTVFDLHEAAAGPGIEMVIANSKAIIRTTGPWVHKRKDGSEFQAEISSHPIEFEGFNARFCMVIDVTDRQRLHEQLVHRAHHDSLTNLPNRFLLDQRMRHTLENASRHNSKVAILCIDLDRFKQINDNYGHAIGDACLQEVASRFTARLRESDTVARTGGEEFTIVLGDLHSVGDAEKVAADLLAGFRREFIVAGLDLELSASIGIALYPDHGIDGLRLWHAADLAMYRAKKSGGDNYMVVDSAECAASDLLSLAAGQLIKAKDPNPVI
ncbi:MAG TPA: diguanylate cyclase [Pseudacidobacterium sp.]|nr:diguanylate cyclase [Pseudacidobacterium sp.]